MTNNQKNSLSQRSFAKKQNKTGVYRPPKLSNSSDNISAKKFEFSVGKVVVAVLFIFYILFNYSILRTLGFDTNSFIEYFGFVIMIIAGAVIAVIEYHIQNKKRDGIFGCHLISFVFSLIGDFTGIAAVFLIWFFIYIVYSITS